jgi:hypothetical protein
MGPDAVAVVGGNEVSRVSLGCLAEEHPCWRDVPTRHSEPSTRHPEPPKIPAARLAYQSINVQPCTVHSGSDSRAADRFSRKWPRGPWLGLGVIVLIVALVFASHRAGSRASDAGASSPTSSHSPASVIVEGANAVISLASVSIPTMSYTASAGPTVELTPSGPLPQPATLHFQLANPVPADQGVVIATSESGMGGWSFLPAILDGSRRVATLTVTHFSFFSPVKVLVNDLLSAFKSQFMDAFTGGLLRDVPAASCAGDPATNGYGAISPRSSVVTWCLGYENGKNILRVTNQSRYPLELSHANLDVVEQPSLLKTWWKSTEDVVEAVHCFPSGK